MDEQKNDLPITFGKSPAKYTEWEPLCQWQMCSGEMLNDFIPGWIRDSGLHRKKINLDFCGDIVRL
jgi:hypothetical protein